jgi:hypothetical protein
MDPRIGRQGDALLYNVVFAGRVIVKRSRDPETDLARALLAEGYTGTVTMLDGSTGKPRTIISIDKAAKITAQESGYGPRFVKYRKGLETVLEAPPAGESVIPVGRVP